MAFCSNCGHEIQKGARFCTECGYKVMEVGTSTEEIKAEAAVNASKDAVEVKTADTVNAAETEEVSKEEVEEAANDVAKETVKEEVLEEASENEESKAFVENAAADGSDNTSEGLNRDFEEASEEEEFDLNKFATIENLERFAPIAALAPVCMVVVVGILGGFLNKVVGSIAVGEVIVNITLFLLKAIFIIVTLSATIGLSYVVVKKKNKKDINAWIVPIGTLMAATSCLSIATGNSKSAWFFGFWSTLLGLEFLARIVIAKRPMDSPLDFPGAFAAYVEYLTNYKKKYPTTKELEKLDINKDGESYFDGSGAELFGLIILTTIISVITCGLGTPWMICKIYSWRLSHTVINGKRLTFTGSGGSLLGHWILWEILCIITCGIYGLFVYVDVRKWLMERTYIDGETIVANGNESFFDGGKIEYLGYSVAASIILMVTCGLAYPWVMVMLQKWDTSHCVINKRRLVFSGTGLEFLGEFLIIFVLSVITLGIYGAWGTVRMNKYIIRHTDFVD